MNVKGLLLVTIGIFLIYLAVKGTFRDVWAALTTKGGASNAG